MTTEAQHLIIRRLLADRVTKVVTSVTLQVDLAKEKRIEVESSVIRKLLKRKGYAWLPRSQKRKYTREQKQERVAFAKSVLRLTQAALRDKLCMSLDGVVLSMPPGSEVERFNH